MYSASSSTLANLVTPLAMSPRHVDSTWGGAVLALETGTRLALLNSALQRTGTDVLPLWSQDGYGRTASAAKAFFDSTGTKRIAVVSDTATPPRHGLVTFP